MEFTTALEFTFSSQGNEEWTMGGKCIIMKKNCLKIQWAAANGRDSDRSFYGGPWKMKTKIKETEQC